MLVGYSLGGRFALGLVLDTGVSIGGLVLISTSCGLFTEEEHTSRRGSNNSVNSVFFLIINIA